MTIEQLLETAWYVPHYERLKIRLEHPFLLITAHFMLDEQTDYIE